MKPERIEELAETAFHLASPAHKWEFSHESWKDRYRDIARALYAAAMRDAAGVASASAICTECYDKGLEDAAAYLERQTDKSVSYATLWRHAAAIRSLKEGEVA